MYNAAYAQILYIFLPHFKNLLRPVLCGFCFLYQVRVNYVRILFHKGALYVEDIINRFV